MKSIVAAAVTAAYFLTASSAPAQELVLWDEVEGWSIYVDPSLGNGCLIQAEYDNGVLVRIGFDRTEGMGYVTAFSSDWGDIEEGATYPIEFDLDGEMYQGEAKGIYLNGVPGADIYFDSPDFLFDIARKYVMTLHNDGGGVMAIELGGSFAALEAAMECQDQQG